jgi:hypothetical protein
MQHRQEGGALGGKSELALPGQILQYRTAAHLLPQPLEQQRRSDPPAHGIGRSLALDHRQHHRTLRQTGDRARQPVEIAARNDDFPAPEIGDDALLGAAILAHVLDQVDVAVRADALVAGEHALSIVILWPESSNQRQIYSEFSTTILVCLDEPLAFPPFSVTKIGRTVQVG